MGSTSTKKKGGTKGGNTPPLVYTEEEHDAEMRALYEEHQQEIDQILQRRYGVELATRQILSEMEYNGNGAPAAGDFTAYTKRAEEILAYIRDGVPSADGA